MTIVDPLVTGATASWLHEEHGHEDDRGFLLMRSSDDRNRGEQRRVLVEQPLTAVDIRLLGDFQVMVDGRTIAEPWPQRRAAELVKLLALAPRHRLHREQVIELLWPHLDPEPAYANLHKAASCARSALGSKDALILRSGWVELWPDRAISTDAERFEVEGRVARDAGDQQRCAALAAQYGEGLLPRDRYTEWTAAPRQRLHQLYLDLLRQAQQWSDLVRLDPSDEEAHQALMRGFMSAGRRHAALRQFEQLTESLNELDLEPSPESAAMLRALAPEPPSAVQPVSPAPLIGRSEELARVTTALRGVSDERPGAVLIAGEAGIGKTRFCEEVLAHMRARGWTTAWGCLPREEGTAPYAPIIEAFGRLLAQRRHLADGLSSTGQAALAQLLAPPVLPSEADPSVRGSHSIFSAVTELLDLAASATGAVLWIDDFHEADDATARLAHHLARLARQAGFTVILSYRSEALPEAIRGVTSSLAARHAALEIELGGLSAGAAEQLIARVAKRGLSRETVGRILELGSGHPFFTEELAKAVDRSGAVAIPQRLHELFLRRVRDLAAPTRAALELAAVTGESFTAEDLSAFSGLNEAQLVSAMRAGIDSGIIRDDGAGYRFRHGLLRDALVARLPSDRHRAFHAHAARTLASHGAAPGRIGHHLIEAGRTGEAVGWLQRAAREAVAVGAIADARAFLDSALRFAPRDAALLELRADCLLASGSPTSVMAYAEAIAAARGQRRRRLRIRLARAAIFLGDIETARRSLTGLSPRGPVESTRVLVTHGYLQWLSGKVSEASRSAEEAYELASLEGLTPELRDAATLRALVAHSRGDMARQLELDLFDSRSASQLAASVHDGHLCVAELYLNGGRSIAPIEAFARELATTAERNGAERGRAFAILLLGETELFSGRLMPAKAHLSEAASLYRRISSPGGEALALHRLAEASLLLGSAEEANDLLSEALELAHGSAFLGAHLLHRIYGTMIQSSPQPADALTVLIEAELVIGRQHEHCRMCVMALAVPAASACARAGELSRSRAYLSRAKESASGLGRRGAWQAAIVEVEAGIAEAEGLSDKALAHYARAVDLFASAGRPLEADRCRLQLATLRRSVSGTEALMPSSGRAGCAARLSTSVA